MNKDELERLHTDWRAYDALYQKWLTKFPGRPMSEFNHKKGLAALAKGKEHHTLGHNLIDKRNWWELGISAFNHILEGAMINSSAKVCEIGCGSLRVGAHFIKRQDIGCYHGMDILKDFIQYGVEIIGNLKVEKKARLSLISTRLTEVIAWQPDLVFSTAVTLHIPPEEEVGHFNMLKELASKPGAKVVIQTYLADEEMRFARSGWARPVEHFCELMKPLKLVSTIDDEPWPANGYEIDVKFLTFKRA